jgi:endonuclease YncB( thermonuclease family)
MKLSFSLRHWVLYVVGLFFCMTTSQAATSSDLQEIQEAVLIDQPGNDGDSFLVSGGGKKFRVRLYFVDAPESAAPWDSDLARVKEQRRYFGLPDEKTVLTYGKQAAAFTREKLSKPFTVYTTFASALGRSPEGRVYAFVRTARGEDLGRSLVQNGLARAYGVGRETPDGLSRDEMKARLADLEAAAMLKNLGVWQSSDPDRLEEYRADQRKEDQALEGVRQELQGGEKVVYPLNINTCSAEELQTIKGIGPVLAGKIMAGRPYRSLEDLLKIQGISSTKLESWREVMKVE